MTEVDITNPRLVPEELIVCYLEQLLAHTGQDVRELCGGVPPRELAIRNRLSYKLWLSYAKLDIMGEGEGRLDWRWCQTDSTLGVNECLRNASQHAINSYLLWVFPAQVVEEWSRAGHPDGLRYFVSPVHFWFFKFDGLRQSTIRPFVNTPNPADFFCHPILSVTGHNGDPPFVVPEQFLDASAPSNLPSDYKSASYYLFPFFAWKLSCWLRNNDRCRSFGTYYCSDGCVWMSPQGSEKGWLASCPPLKENWRWEEVMEMLGEQAEKTIWRGTSPAGCLDICGVGSEPRIMRYLDCFGTVALAWWENRCES